MTVSSSTSWSFDHGGILGKDQEITAALRKSALRWHSQYDREIIMKGTPIKLVNTGAAIDRMGIDCGPMQWVREYTHNAI